MAQEELGFLRGSVCKSEDELQSLVERRSIWGELEEFSFLGVRTLLSPKERDFQHDLAGGLSHCSLEEEDGETAMLALARRRHSRMVSL